MTSTTQKLLQAIAQDQSARAAIEQSRSVEECVSIAVAKGKSLGLDVSPEQVRQGYAQAVNRPLSDAELESVVGGKPEKKDGYTIIKGHDSSWWNNLWGLSDDDMEGTEGKDKMYGYGGDDLMYGNGGDDYMEGGEGDDEMYGGSGNDTMHGGAGDDHMEGGSGNDTLYGGAGNDSLEAGGESTLDGGEGDDDLLGYGGDQTLLGGEGNDRLEGQTGDDFLEGGAGDDILYGMAKGAQGWKDGSDVFVFGTDDGNDIIGDFTVSEDKFLFRGADSIDDIEVVNIGDDTIIQYGETRITVQGVTLSAEEVWNMRYTEEGA